MQDANFLDPKDLLNQLWSQSHFFLEQWIFYLTKINQYKIQPNSEIQPQLYSTFTY